MKATSFVPDAEAVRAHLVTTVATLAGSATLSMLEMTESHGQMMVIIFLKGSFIKRVRVQRNMIILLIKQGIRPPEEINRSQGEHSVSIGDQLGEPWEFENNYLHSWENREY